MSTEKKKQVVLSFRVYAESAADLQTVTEALKALEKLFEDGKVEISSK